MDLHRHASFTVTVRGTGERFPVAPSESILVAALRHGVDLPRGCNAGVCGVCVSWVIEGKIDYPDGPPLGLFEEDVADGKALCCVGHPRSDITLEPCERAGDWEPWD